MNVHQFEVPAMPFGTRYSGDPCATCGQPQAALIHAVDHAVQLRRLAVIVNQIVIGDVDTHVGSGDPHYEAHVPCDTWCELEEMLSPFRAG